MWVITEDNIAVNMDHVTLMWVREINGRFEVKAEADSKPGTLKVFKTKDQAEEYIQNLVTAANRRNK